MNNIKNIYKHIIGIVCLLTLLSPVFLYAQTLDEDISAFKQYVEISSIDIKVPTVVEIPITPGLFMTRYSFGILNTITNEYQPYYLDTNYFVDRTPVQVKIDRINNEQSLVDGNYKTKVDFPLTLDGSENERVVEYSFEKPIKSSQLRLTLDNHVKLPNTIKITAKNNGVEEIIVAKTRVSSNTINFLETSSRTWTITLTYSQPMRINEMQIIQAGVEESITRGLRFLAQPSHSYRIYFDADRSTHIKTSEKGDLSNDNEVLKLPTVTAINNPLYKQSDIDEDGIVDRIDNCVNVANPNQVDVNNNGRGDACDDFDRDGVMNNKDNCVDLPNSRQKDTDGDGLGDACDDEESRVTEKYAWLPWAGMGGAAIVIIMLFIITLRGMKKEDEGNQNDDEVQDVSVNQTENLEDKK